ncbi:hypothetical protein GGS20DRAFT_587998 [Poronia punctata]|nr:hypothetical protein GGS20DRAFT_587998 [Poronia punctata]
MWWTLSAAAPLEDPWLLSGIPAPVGVPYFVRAILSSLQNRQRDNRDPLRIAQRGDRSARNQDLCPLQSFMTSSGRLLAVPLPIPSTMVRCYLVDTAWMTREIGPRNVGRRKRVGVSRTAAFFYGGPLPDSAARIYK